MKLLFDRQCFFATVAIVLTVYTLSASAVPAKDHKKKLLEKLRNSLNQTELEEAGGDVDALEVAAEAVAVPEAIQDTKEEDEVVEKPEEEDEPVSEEKKTGELEKASSEKDSTELQKQDGPTSYLLKMRTVLKRIFDMFGFRTIKKKEGRQNRMLSNDDSYNYNGLDYGFFKDDIRTTVGAVLGEKECIQKVVCGAGSYLRDVNGKQAILTILEHVTPSAYMDTVELLKQSAVTEGDCVYKCLESDPREDQQ